MYASACVLKFHIRSAHSGPFRTVHLFFFSGSALFSRARLALHNILETPKEPGAGAPRPLVILSYAPRPHPCLTSDRLCLYLVGQNHQCWGIGSYPQTERSPVFDLEVMWALVFKYFSVFTRHVLYFTIPHVFTFIIEKHRWRADLPENSKGLFFLTCALLCSKPGSLV